MRAEECDLDERKQKKRIWDKEWNTNLALQGLTLDSSPHGPRDGHSLGYLCSQQSLIKGKDDSLNQGPHPAEEVTLPCKEVKPETEPLSLLLPTVLASITGYLTGLNAPR